MKYLVTVAQRKYEVEILNFQEPKAQIRINGKIKTLDIKQMEQGVYSVIMDGESYDIDVEGQVPLLTLYIRGKKIPVELKSEREIVRSQITSPKRKDVEHVIRAPIPGRVVKCLVKEGDKVVPEQGIIVIDAMKMENELKSPTTGTVIEISVHPGQDIEAGERLAVIT